MLQIITKEQFQKNKLKNALLLLLAA